MGLVSIPEFYAGKQILVTGATGFMGKVLIEKLLRSCPDVEKIFVVIRCRKDSTPNERLKELLDKPCFNRLSDADKAKVVAVSGDLMEMGVGLSDKDRREIQSNVSIVFHGAASVRFNDSLKKATLMNTRGTREMLDLAKGMKKLEVFLHVSTTYCNTDRREIEEKVYPLHADWRKTIQLAERMEEHTLEILAPKYLDSFPNTYTFTKSLSEQLVNDYAKEMPIIIFRPSIVISAVDEPFPGWLDNFNGPIGLLVAGAKGIVHVSLAGPDVVSDYMPVDYAIKAMVAAVWQRAVTGSPAGDLIVYNCSACGIKMITIKEMLDMGIQINQDYPTTGILWRPWGTVTKSRTLFYVFTMLFQILPALLIDTVLKLYGQKPMLMKIQRRIYVANLALSYFSLREWTFHHKNFRTLRDKLLPQDKDTFYYHYEQAEVFQYFTNAQAGVRKFLLGEKEDDLPRARMHLQRMIWLDRVCRMLLGLLVIWTIMSSRLFQRISYSSAALLESIFIQ